ncbi:hypothetical protein HF563_08195 [Acidithiobacillus ferridurans]|uniref:hypothetical protein n=1 Tax=Acidithiobacillus ferridurans TaxID=1232575 RepID=UPI001C0798CC|nr:hypothetical protein [Acidithiobacillus ferridurans]MBU2719353.1 hypothetical protein [Acidithiobacillus ferridurans]MBU2733463.1 hypothetical protein [Acidithiobacillus ferridurans]
MKAKNLQQRVYEAVKSGQLVRTKGTPAEKMTDFELTRFLVEHTPDHDIEYYLMMADRGARVEVSGVPEVRPEDSEDLIETLTRLAHQCGGRVRVAGEGLDGAPMDVTIYDGRPNGTRTHE